MWRLVGIWMWFLFLNQCTGFRICALMQTYRRLLSRRKHLALCSVPRPSGYIPPELDPEFNSGNQLMGAMSPPSQSKNSSTTSPTADAFMSFPVPKEGDIVRYRGRFGSLQLGRLRFLQYVEAYKEFYVDITPLKESKTPMVFTVDLSTKTEYLPISQVQPVKATFVRMEDGYRLYKQQLSNTNSTSSTDTIDQLVLRAQTYRPLEPTFAWSKKPVDVQVLVNDFTDYEALKQRVTTRALQIGLVLSAVLGFAYGLDLSAPYFLGVLSSCVYFFLLGQKVDSIGAKYSVLKNNTTTADTPGSISNIFSSISSAFGEQLSQLRFLVPVILITVLALKDKSLHLYTPAPFHILPQKEFLAAMAGFLTLRLSLFLSEVFSTLRKEDVAGVVPGSAGIFLREFLMKKDQSNTTTQSAKPALILPTKVLLLTGPVAAGRYELAARLFGTNTSALSSQPTLTLDSLHPQMRVVYCNLDQRDNVVSSDVVFVGDDKDYMGRSIRVAVPESLLQPRRFPAQDAYATWLRQERQRREQRQPSREKDADPETVYVLVGPPALHDALYAAREKLSLELTTVWVSLRSKDEFVARATQMVQQRQAESQRLLTSTGLTIDQDAQQKLTQEVDVLVQDAATDVTYFMQRAAAMDYTILYAKEEEAAALEEVRQIVAGFKAVTA